MEFPYDKIVKLAERISNMRDKKYKNDLKIIKKIIENNNPDISMTKNNNGYFAPDFENLNYNTYIELLSFFEKKDEDNKSSSSEINNSQLLSEKIDNEKNLVKKLKYTNSESHILKKIKYEKTLQQHQSECAEENEKNNKHLKIKELEKIIKKTNSNEDLQMKKDSEKIFKKHKKNEKKLSK
jgi:hypothetical protein